MQSSLAELISYLGSRARRSKIIAVGTTVPKWLQSRFRCQFIGDRFEERTDRLQFIDIANLSNTDLDGFAGPDSIVLCKTIDTLGELTRSRILSAAAHWFEQNALIIHSSSDLLDTSEPELLDGFSPLLVGTLPGLGNDEQPQTVALYDREVQDALSGSVQGLPRPLAILSAFNEEDVIKEVVEDLVQQGCDVFVLDNWSTDDTWEILQSLRNIFCSQLKTERFPLAPVAQSSWVDILGRKEEIALQHAGRWILHSDADELRRSPFSDCNLARAMYVAQSTGATRIDFTVLNFRPVDAAPFIPGTLKSAFKYFQFGSHPSYFQQRKAWFQGRDRVNLRSDGGHSAEFENAVDFRYKFWLKHFPIRSMSHGRKKLNLERAQRWSQDERKGGWHVHYNNMHPNSSFVWPVEKLYEYRRATFNKSYGLTIMTSIAERMQAEATPSAETQPFLWCSQTSDEQHQSTDGSTQVKLSETEALKAQVAEREKRLESMRIKLSETGRHIEDLNVQVAEREKRLAETEVRIKELSLVLAALRNSTSWRVTAPVRSIIKRLRSIYR